MLIFSSSAVRLADASAFATAHQFDFHPNLISSEDLRPLATSPHSLALEFAEAQIQLRSLSQPKLKPLSVDFMAGKAGFRQQKAQSAGGSAQEQVLKAMSLHRNSGAGLTVIDATAGLGRDAYIIAGQVDRVLMFERHPVLVSLLKDGLKRAGGGDPSQMPLEIIGRMQLCEIDFSLWTPEADLQVDIVYLDPMFAADADARVSRKKSALVKKDMQLLHKLHGAELSDSAQRALNERKLFDKAISLNPARIVVKRARFAPFLADESTDLQLDGKAGRFDIYALRSLKKPPAR